MYYTLKVILIPELRVAPKVISFSPGKEMESESMIDLASSKIGCAFVIPAVDASGVRTVASCNFCLALESPRPA